MTKSRDLANAATALNAVTATELGFVDGVTSAIQTQIDTKLATATAATTYVANSLADAKGDLFVATADNTVTRFPVSTQNGDTIVADSSTSTGLRYTAGTVQANPVLNSAMQVWQRGTSIAITSVVNSYSADRWQCGVNVNQNTTIARQVTGDTTNLPNIQYCARVQRNSGQTGTGTSYFTQSMETVNSIPFAGKIVTVSFYARKGADYSPTSSSLTTTLSYGTGTDQNVLGTYTGQTTVVSAANTLTATWQRFTMTGTVGTTATELAMAFAWSSIGTAGTNDYFEVTGVQIDIGSVALPFRTNGGTIQGELAACQRYYQRKTSVGNATLFGMGQASSTTQAYYSIPIPVSFRVAPSVSHSSAAGWTSSTGGAGGTIAAFQMSADSVSLQISGGAGLVAGNASALVGTSASAYLELSAEL